MFRLLHVSLIGLSFLPAPVVAPQHAIDLAITHTYDGIATICVPLSVPAQPPEAFLDVFGRVVGVK